MKKIIYLTIALLCLSSCTDFLKEESRTNLSKDQYMNNAFEAENVLLGVYSIASRNAMYGYSLSMHFSLGTDMEQVEGASTERFRTVPTNSFPTTQSEIQDTWQALYAGIYAANDFIEGISVKMKNFSDDDKDLAVIYLAEARALRGWYYFELVRRWNRVVLMTSTAQSELPPTELKIADPIDVYKYIEKDLQYASETLPWATEDVYRADNSFRLSKGAVLGLLAKVYVTWAGYPHYDKSKWQLAAEAAGEVIMSGKHNLLPDFEQLWKNTCNGIWDPTESLIEISFYSPTVSGSADPVGRIGKWNGVKTTMVEGVRGSCAGNYKVVHPFVVEWRTHTGDLREKISVANYRYSNDDNKPELWVRGKSDTEAVALANDADPQKKQKEKQSYTPAKWDVQKYVTSANYLLNNDSSNINWYFLRYADVLLLYAEALNEWKDGPTAEAYAAINEVRRRAYAYPTDGSADCAEGMSQEEFRQAVRMERAYELAFEGHRRLDLVRWGIYYETIQKTYEDIANWWEQDGSFYYTLWAYTVKGKHEFLPIPQRDVDLCKFEQNPNWN